MMNKLLPFIIHFDNKHGLGLTATLALLELSPSLPLPFRFDDEAGLAEKPLNVVEMT